MKVYFDNTPAVRAPSTGIGQVTRSLAEALQKVAHEKSGTPLKIQEVARGKNFAFIKRLLGEKGALFHSLEHRQEALLFSKKILSIHDCWTLWPNAWQSSSFQSKGAWIQASAMKRADRIVTPTDYVKNEVLRFNPQFEKKTYKISWASPLENVRAATLESLDPPLRDFLNSPKPFVFHVGNLEARKNQKPLFEAMSRLTKDFNFLLLTGLRGFGSEHSQGALEVLKTQQNVLHLEGLCPEAIKLCYQKSSLCVFPSWEEGFGLPVLEAMKEGALLLLSQIPSFTELAHEGAFYFDPKISSQDLADLIYNLLQNSEPGELKKSAALKRASQFLWHKSALEYLKIYRDLSEET